jgi:hypothetical protein
MNRKPGNLLSFDCPIERGRRREDSMTSCIFDKGRLAAVLLAAGCSLLTSACDDETNPVDGAGGSGAGGNGPGASCLDAAAYSDAFALLNETLCVVAKHQAPFAQGFTLPSWGRHGGLLTIEQSMSPADEITLRRWTAPTSAEGALEASGSSTVLLGISTMPVFMNPQAVDLPFGAGTMVSWAEFGTSNGEAIVVEAGAVTQRFPVAGMLAAAGTGSGSSNDGYVLHTSFSPFDDLADPTNAGLYGAKICAGQLCGTDVLATGGDASGAVAVDANGNVFVTLPDLASGQQSVRTWLGGEQSLDPNGDELLSTGGSGLAIAALAPDADGEGMLFLQPLDGATFEYRDVLMQRYLEQGTNLAAVGSPQGVLVLSNAGSSVSLTASGDGRLWVGIDDASGAAATFYVLARR